MNQKSELVHIYAKLPKVKKPSFIGSISEPDYKLIRNRIIGHGEGGLKSIISTLLEKGGWDVKRDERNIFTPVIETFMQIPDLNLKKLTQFAKNKNSYRFFSHYLELHKPFNLYNMFEQGLKGLYPHEQIVKLVDELWTVTTCVNQVGIGPGEICLTSLTNAKKGARGDLVITDIGDVEVKSTYGRLGSGNNALLFKSRAKKIVGKYVGISESNSWNEVLQNVFYNDCLNIKELINVAVHVSPQELIKTDICLLKKGLSNIFSKFNINKPLKNKERKVLVNLILAIQLSCYQNEHKFKHLLSVNKSTKDAYAFYFPSNKLDKNVLSVYKQIVDVGRFRSNLAIDNSGTRKGIEINFH
jgi:hypothetical protein